MTGTARGASIADAAATPAISAAERVRWGDATLPGSVCDATKPIHLHDGRGIVTPIPRQLRHFRFYGKHYVTVGAGSEHGGVVYGHLTPSGEDAAMYVVCTNGGGTADGQLEWSAVLFRVSAGTPSVIGILRPQVQLPREMPTLLGVAIGQGRIVVHEFFYGPHDGTCCSSGRATSVWTYVGGHLTAGRPVIVRRPS